jgi:alkylation response protein AidB-like acyl-CoA dehydrogenase
MAHIYGLSDAGLKLVETARGVAKDVLAKHAAEADAKAEFPLKSVEALSSAGLMGLCLPTSVGGHGQAPRTFAAVVEELAQACGSTAMIYVMHVTAAAAASVSTIANKDAVLADMASGKHLTTLAFSEKGSRSMFWMPMSKLVPADGGYVTSAYKSWVTSAKHASSFVSSAQKPGAASPLESTVYLLKNPAPGVRIAGGWDGLGLRGNDSAPISVEDYRVAEGDLMTAHGGGLEMMLQVVLPWFTVGTSAMGLGLARAAVAATASHLTTTNHDSGTALRDFPNLRGRLATMNVKTEAARALLGYTVGEMEAPDAMTPLFVLQTRLNSLETACEVTDLAMKACGGAAFSKHLPVERAFRDARAGWVMAPTVDHLHEFVGKALTGLPLL